MNIGEIIRYFRIATNCSSKQLAQRMGVSLSYLSDVELGRKNISIETLNKFAEALGVLPSEIYKIWDLSKKNNWDFQKILFEVLKLFLDE